MMQEVALTTLAYVVNFSQEHFQNYYDVVIPFINPQANATLCCMPNTCDPLSQMDLFYKKINLEMKFKR